MRMPELKCLARDRGLRNYSRMRKAELVALLQNNPFNDECVSRVRDRSDS